MARGWGAGIGTRAEGYEVSGLRGPQLLQDHEADVVPVLQSGEAVDTVRYD